MASRSGFENILHDYKDVDRGHGRLEVRKHWILEGLETLPKTAQWEGLATLA